MKKKKLLLVDDEKLILKTLGRGLREKGFAVTTAGNKATAELKLRQNSYDIVVTDLVMEGLDGIQLLKKAKKIDRDISVIILTAYADMSSAIDALREGADDYLLKPCNVDELHLRISRCLEKQSLRKEATKYSAELERTNKKLKTEITERKQAEEALRNLSIEQKLIFNSVTAAIWYKDLKNKILRVNKAGAKSVGMKVEDIEGKFVHELFPEEAEKYYQDDLEVMLSGKPKLGIIEELQAASGKKIWVSTDKVLFKDKHGKTTGLVAFVTDITESTLAAEKLQQYSEQLEEMVQERTKELKSAQEELVRKEKLAMLGLLSSSVGHELRNPLAAINNAIYYLKMVLPDAEDTVKEYMGMISSEIDKAKKIVSDLLDFSRIKQGKKEDIAVFELISYVLEEQSPPDKIKFTSKISPTLPAVCVDPRQIEQVLSNLVTNAYQAMSDGGILSIKTKSIKNNVLISVSDTGCGIASEDYNMIFEPLFTTKERGVGLGLTITRNMVEANGGSIKVKNNKGKGVTFVVSLPTKEI